MFEPVDINDILISVMAGALVVMFGALYALAFAIGRLQESRIIGRLAYLFFAMLVISALTLAATLHLTGIWQIVTAVILAGYLLAPHAIWKLCVGTHPDKPVARPANDRSYS